MQMLRPHRGWRWRYPVLRRWINEGPGEVLGRTPGLLHARARLKARLPRLYASAARLCPVRRESMADSEQTFRLYNCRRCATQVRICRDCDHGNLYCAGECAQICRRESKRRACERYQLSHRGARHHADRQRALRERRRLRPAQIVTHQGSLADTATPIVAASSIPSPTEEIHVDVASIQSPPPLASPLQAGLRASPTRTYRPFMAPLAHRCSFCRCALPAFARRGPLRGGP